MFSKLALLAIAGGVLAVFFISGFQAKNLFAPSVTEDAIVKIKQDSKCIVEPSDNVPRTISDCPYNVGDVVPITYKEKQPAVERHELKSLNGGSS